MEPHACSVVCACVQVCIVLCCVLVCVCTTQRDLKWKRNAAKDVLTDYPTDESDTVRFILRYPRLCVCGGAVCSVCVGGGGGGEGPVEGPRTPCPVHVRRRLPL
jgi:hypothetical protein